MPVLRGGRWLAAAALTVALVTGIAVAVEGVEPDHTWHLLLRNGQVLSGQVSYEGDFYRVALPTGEIRVRRGEVQDLCRSFPEVYQRKLATVSADDFLGQLRLADWCLRNELLSEAEGLIAQAARLAPDHARVRVAQRSLELARNPQGQAPSVPKIGSPQSDVRSVGSPAPYDQSELDRLTRNMPEGTMEAFRNTIQPMLVSGCAAAKCHGSAATSEFRLIRPLRGHLLSRRATQRNLQAVLGYLGPADGEDSESQILAAATRAHGGRDDPAFRSPDAVPVKQLVAWIVAVTEPAANRAPSRVSTPRVTLSQAVDHDDRERFYSREKNGSDGTANSEGQGPGESGQQVRDAWDPEEFNRRYHGEDDRREH